MDSQFTALASFYDSLMAEIPYRRWVDYVFDVAALHHHPVRRVLDVGCGTGTASMLMANRGCEVVGFDASQEMIAVAKRKASGRTNPTYFVSRMEDLEPSALAPPPSTLNPQPSALSPALFDTAVSLFDTVNYVTDPQALQRAFNAVIAALEPGGLFMFDMNTPYALEMELFTQNNLKSRGEPKYSWVSRYNAEERLTTVDMSFYVKQGNTRVTVKETHCQRAYTLPEMNAMLNEAGFEVLDTFDAFSFRRPKASTDRAFLVALRPQS